MQQYVIRIVLVIVNTPAEGVPKRSTIKKLRAHSSTSTPSKYRLGHRRSLVLLALNECLTCTHTILSNISRRDTKFALACKVKRKL